MVILVTIKSGIKIQTKTGQCREGAWRIGRAPDCPGFSAGIDFKRQILKSIPAKYFEWLHTHNIGIQIKRKELTETCMMI